MIFGVLNGCLDTQRSTWCGMMEFLIGNRDDHMTRLTSNCRLTKYTWNEQAPIKRNACMTDHHLTRENVDSAAVM